MLSGLKRHNQATFQARAVPARAAIDQIYTTGPFPAPVGNGGPSLNEDGVVHFQAQGRTAHARVVLVSDCSGACLPVYRVGQVLTVYYNPQNLTYAQLNPPGPPNLIGFAFGFSLFALFGLTFLAAAVINGVAAAQDSWQVKRAKKAKKVRSPPPRRTLAA
jgi:hypothetical protein